MNIHHVNIAYHRNGVSGTGFHVVLFDWKDEDGQMHRMMATVFPEPGCIAVLDRDETAKGNIDFAYGNSWRGDYFETAIREAIERHDNPASISNLVVMEVR